MLQWLIVRRYRLLKTIAVVKGIARDDSLGRYALQYVRFWSVYLDLLNRSHPSLVTVTLPLPRAVSRNATS